MAVIKSITQHFVGGAVRWRLVGKGARERFRVEAFTGDTVPSVLDDDQRGWVPLATVATERDAQDIVSGLHCEWRSAANRFFATLPRAVQSVAASAQRARVPARVGDTVEFMFGTALTTATVIEDRGLLGVGGRRILGVRVKMGRDVPPLDTEVAEAFVKVVKRKAKKYKRPAR